MLNNGVEVLWLLDADEFDVKTIPDNCFVIYQGHHGEKAAARADVILPGATYTEKSGTYTNTEGRVQRSYRAIFPPGMAKEDWSIIVAVAKACEHELPFYDLESLRDQMVKNHPVFASIGLQESNLDLQKYTGATSKNIEKQPVMSIISDYFLTNSISRASSTMQECSKLRQTISAEAAE